MVMETVVVACVKERFGTIAYLVNVSAGSLAMKLNAEPMTFNENTGEIMPDCRGTHTQNSPPPILTQ